MRNPSGSEVTIISEGYGEALEEVILCSWLSLAATRAAS